MRDLEEKFGKKHPELEGYTPPPPQYYWLQSAFFRLHRRRQVGGMGVPLPLSFQEIIVFGERVLKLPEDLISLYVWCMEITDEAVLTDMSRSQDSKKPSTKR